MSYRDSRGYRSRNDEGSVFQGGSAGGPPLQVLMAGTVLLGLVCLIIVIAVSSSRPAQQVAAPAAPAPTAVPTAAPMPTEAPAAAPAASGSNNGSLAETGTAAETVSSLPAPNALAFAETTLSLPADTLVTLVFDNQNDLGVQHNWVLVDGGDDVAAAVNTAAGGNAGELFIPPAGTDGALAYTAMTNAGQQSEVTFRTPAPGTYLFICTFPGHYPAGMKGELTVTN